MTCNIRVYYIVFNSSMHIVTCFHAFTPDKPNRLYTLTEPWLEIHRI